MTRKKTPGEPVFYVVEEGIPIPPRETLMSERNQRSREKRYPFSDMLVGDSFLVPGTTSRPTLTTSMNRFRKRYGWKFRTARMPDLNWRCWRIE